MNGNYFFKIIPSCNKIMASTIVINGKRVYTGKYKEQLRRYNKSEKGRMARKKYESSEKFRIKRIAQQKRYYQRKKARQEEEIKAIMEQAFQKK
jgi:hypothetical protein